LELFLLFFIRSPVHKIGFGEYLSFTSAMATKMIISGDIPWGGMP
jgi:hypothetical protein